MWRSPARRVFICRGAAAPELSQPFVRSQVSRHETLTTTLQSNESGFRLTNFSCWVSAKSRFYQIPRFFSSNTSENYEDSPSEPLTAEANEVTDGFDFSSTNVFDENTSSVSSGFENEDSIFEGADDFGRNESFDEKFVSVVTKDGSVGHVKDNDPEKVEDFLSMLRSRDPIRGSLNSHFEGLFLNVAEDGSDGHAKDNDPEKVESLLSLLQSRGTISGSLEPHFEEMGLFLNEDFVLKVLETPSVPGENLIHFVRWALRKLELKVTARVLDKLVSVTCQENSKRDAYAFWDLVNEVGEKGTEVISTDCLNKLIEHFSRIGKGKAAFDVFSKFEELRCLLNADSYYFTIEALCKRSFFDWACAACEKMLNAGKLPEGERVGKIISYLCKGNKAKDAHLVYLYAKDKKIYPPRQSVNFLISSLSRIKRTDKETEQEIDKELDKETVSLALEMLDDYSAEDRKPAINPFSSVLKKLCWIEDIGRAKKLLLEMIDAGPPPGNSLFNCVVNGLSKVGDMDEARKIMKMMENRGLKPDVYTYNVILSGYSRDGAMEEASKIFDEAKKKHSKLSPITYHTLIRGFCKLEQFDKAVNLLGEMKQHGVKPNHDEYNKLIKSLCLKALDWKTAEKLLEDMRENGLILNGRTRALISAVKELKEEVAELEVPAAA